jgi:hypothetical protein
MNVVHCAALIAEYLGVRGKCCMKYKNSPAKPPFGGEILLFIQQLQI